MDCSLQALPTPSSRLRPALGWVLGAAATLGGASARAGVVLSYADFTGACGTTLTCVGNTAVNGTEVRLTPAAGNQAGAAYSTTPITLGTNATFSATFQFRFTGAGGIDPADGITFVLARGTTGLGSVGGGLGYQGVPNSVAVEFDTFNNFGSDISSNHVAIDTNGALTNTPSVNPYGVATCDFGTGIVRFGCMANGDIWTATIGYDGSLLTVSVQDGGAAVQTVIDRFPIDIAALLGTTTAYAGFTSATGGGYENHDILNFRLANDTSLAADPGSVPEPGSLALIGAAFVGSTAPRRSRR